MSWQEEDSTLGVFVLPGPGGPMGAVQCAAQAGRRTTMPVGPSSAGGAGSEYSPALSPAPVAAEKLALQSQGVPSAAEDRQIL